MFLWKVTTNTSAILLQLGACIKLILSVSVQTSECQNFTENTNVHRIMKKCEWFATQAFQYNSPCHSFISQAMSKTIACQILSRKEWRIDNMFCHISFETQHYQIINPSLVWQKILLFWNTKYEGGIKVDKWIFYLLLYISYRT